MNLTLKAIYYCYTSSQTWGKGYTVEDAKKNAKVVKGNEKRLQFVVYAAVFDNPKEDELKNLHNCITANQMDGSPQYYRDDRTPEDTEMIDRLHIGWLIINKNF